MFVESCFLYASCIISCLTKLNYDQLQCIMLVNGPVIILSDDCHWTILRENEIKT